ncbi:MAG: peptidoglycan recognition protein family protein, partial [Lachnospiraceae bacterium]|nr:peptidoglycan recognition protein family protein [Lachnospiraceae bacterium]
MWIAAMTAAIVFMGKNFYQSMQKSPVIKEDRTQKPSVEEALPLVDEREKKPQIREDFLTISEYNRPGTKLAEVNNIFVHYTANQGTSAAQNRSYFENLGQTHERAASAHFIIGYEGEIVQCIPLDEEAY